MLANIETVQSAVCYYTHFCYYTHSCTRRRVWSFAGLPSKGPIVLFIIAVGLDDDDD